MPILTSVPWSSASPAASAATSREKKQRSDIYLQTNKQRTERVKNRSDLELTVLELTEENPPSPDARFRRD